MSLRSAMFSKVGAPIRGEMVTKYNGRIATPKGFYFTVDFTTSLELNPWP